MHKGFTRHMISLRNIYPRIQENQTKLIKNTYGTTHGKHDCMKCGDDT